MRGPDLAVREASLPRLTGSGCLPRLCFIAPPTNITRNLTTAKDGDPVVQLHVERTIAASPERVFDWLTDPANLTAAPMALKAGWAKGSPGPGVGAVREMTAVGTRFREEITAYDPPRSYSYRIVRAFPAIDHEGGTLTFTPSGEGTHVDWVSTYTHPARAGSKAMEAVSSRLLRSSFVAILAGCAKALEK